MLLSGGLKKSTHFSRCYMLFLVYPCTQPFTLHNFFSTLLTKKRRRSLFHLKRWLNFFNPLDKSLSCQCTRGEIEGREKGKGDMNQGHTLFFFSSFPPGQIFGSIHADVYTLITLPFTPSITPSIAWKTTTQTSTSLTTHV
jgi:hypothetical protein